MPIPAEKAAGAASAELYQRLIAAVGERNVLVDAEDLEPFCGDLLGIYRGRPRCVVRPATTAEAAAVLAACAYAGVAVVPCGGNTGFAGGAIADASGSQVVVSLVRMNRIRAIDTVGNSITLDAGCVLATAREHAATHGRLLPLSHGGEGSSQIGGNLATNAGGLNVLRYGMARNLVLGLEVVLADGRVLDMMRELRKDNTGYSLTQLFVGSEGTLGLITGAVLKLYPLPVLHETALVALPDPRAALALLTRARANLGESIDAFELVPEAGMDLVREFDPAAPEFFATRHRWYALIECEGAGLTGFLEVALAEGRLVDAVSAQSERERRALWRMREQLAMAQVADRSNLKNDTSVPISAIPDFIVCAGDAVSNVVPGVRTIPFGHVGDGNIHFNLARPLAMAPADFISRWPELTAAVERVAVALGGSISAEHGIGVSKRAALVRARSGVELDMMRALKRALDPRNLMNPGKLL